VRCRRFDNFYAKDGEPWFIGPSAYPFKLGAFWLVQAIWGFAVLLPVTVAQAAKPSSAMGPWGWSGCALFMAFWAYEAVGTLATL
jgi:steroid 5-alpha reductase family enzyme